MASYSGDGTVTPKYLDVSTITSTGSLDDYRLRVGEVVAAFGPNDANNRDPVTKGRQWVYVVNVAYRNGQRPLAIVPYMCTVMDSFGGKGDHLRHTVRCASGDEGRIWGNGAKVLLMCANGDKSTAYILGGVRHPDSDFLDPHDTFLDFEFNGVHASVDADGALSLEVPGATKVDGTPGTRDANNKGSLVSFAKDGQITIDDNDGEKIVISPKDKKISVLAREHTTEVNTHWTLETGGNVMVQSGGDVVVACDGNARVDPTGTLKLGSTGANENLVLGQQLVSALRELADIITDASPLGCLGSPIGPPVVTSPPTMARLRLWKERWAGSPILSGDKFTE